MKNRMFVVPGSFVPYNDTVTLLTYKRLRDLDLDMDVFCFKGKADQSLVKELERDDKFKKFHFTYTGDLDWAIPRNYPFRLPVSLFLMYKYVRDALKEFEKGEYQYLYTSIVPGISHLAGRLIKKKHPEAVFQLAGALDPNPDGIKQEELDDYVRDGTIEFLGYVDMTKALNDCSVFVLPSYYREGVPHAVLEAMGVGRAIITCNTPGCKETVRDADDGGKGKNGFLIESKNSQALAEKMIWMIEHPEEVKAMGIESRKYAEDRFDAEKVNHIMMETMGII